jgi:hypothetical protein
MRRSAALVAVALMISACDQTGPSPDGTLLISTVTVGSDSDQAGYRLTVDGRDSLALQPSGTVQKDISSGQHALRLLGVAPRCSVDPGPSLVVTVPPRGTVVARFDIKCPVDGEPPSLPPVRPLALVRIITSTTGSVPSSARFEVWSAHWGAWDYGFTDSLLGNVGPNDTLIARLQPSTNGGGDPYWYEFHLRQLPANCTGPGASGRKLVRLSTTLQIVFRIGCSP